MRKVHINSVHSGTLTARPIFSDNGNVLIGVGISLTDRYIQRLKNMGIDYIYIEDKNTLDLVPEDVIRDRTRKIAIDAVHKTMTKLMSRSSAKGKVVMPDLGNEFRGIFDEILNDLSGQGNIVINLANLNSLDGYHFHHAVNVAVLAGIIGLSKGYTRNQLHDLGVGALLFDIGMTVYPEDLWKKSTEFTTEQRQRIQKHTEEGFNILRGQYDVSLMSAHCALQHHERYNGTGYPRNLKGDEIHEYAQIVAIADVYDALTSPRNYRARYTPGEAIEFLFAAGNELFNLKLIQIFHKHISIYPLATTVLLNTKQVAVVSGISAESTGRPVVRVIEEADGAPPRSPYEIDLLKHLNITITKTL